MKYLKIKDNVDLKKLKKFGFKKSWSGFYVYVDNDYYIEIQINSLTKMIAGDYEHPVLNYLKEANFVEVVEE